MELILKNHDYRYAAEQIMLTLYPEERPVLGSEETAKEPYAILALNESPVWSTATTVLHVEGTRYEGRARVKKTEMTDETRMDRLRQRIIKRSFYRAAVRQLGEKPVWGALTGVRPARLMRRLLETEPDEVRALRRFMALYDVTAARAELCLAAARHASRVETALEKRDVCLYIGIPFCPTRCAYCSFVSQSVEKSTGLIPAYVDALKEEIAATGEAARQAGLRPVALYMGGGTPSTLTAEELDAVLTAAARAFDLENCRERTVEAGRPDTITAEKLAALRRHDVTRISVNPQTMSDSVLRAIGRRHTAADVVRALDLVREAGVFTVNMDLIAGLPEDTPDSFRESVERVLALEPENVTVHTLSRKKGARITEEGAPLPDGAAVGRMLDTAQGLLRGHGYAPYYLYRQKFISGGYENTGWSLPGKENLYNIVVMEEIRSVLGMGAGASTKLTAGDGRLNRFISPKYPKEYIERIDNVCAEKLTRIPAFYDVL